MSLINENFLKLQDSYLFSTIAKKRQSHVLNAMVQYGYITEEEANSIK